MAKDRQIPCIYYASELNCKKGREGTFNKYCQRCDKYEPRVKMKIKNRKKEELEKIKKKELIQI